jgi:hypothetical protein
LHSSITMHGSKHLKNTNSLVRDKNSFHQCYLLIYLPPNSNGFIANWYFTYIQAATRHKLLYNYVGCVDVCKLVHSTPPDRETEAKPIH